MWTTYARARGFSNAQIVYGEVLRNPEKTKNPEMLTLDSTYRIGNRSFIVEPVFKEESSQTLGEVLLRLMKSESEKL